jgi:hypothetical protein
VSMSVVISPVSVSVVMSPMIASSPPVISSTDDNPWRWWRTNIDVDTDIRGRWQTRRQRGAGI